MREQLTDLEISKIESFCSDEVMFEAVRKVLLQGIYNQGTVQKGQKPDPLKNGALSLAALSTNNPIPDEVLGQHIRGVWAGLNSLENAIKDLRSIKQDIKSPLQDLNEAI